MTTRIAVLLALLTGCSSSGGPGFGTQVDDGGRRDGGAADGGGLPFGRDGGADAGSASSDGGGDAGTTSEPPDAGLARADGGPSIERCTGATFAEPCATCMRTSCASETAACFGPRWNMRDFTDGKCREYFECICPCGGNGGCIAGCPDPSADCITCLAAAKQCQIRNCLLLCRA